MNKIVLLLVGLVLSAMTTQAKSIKVCTDENFWFPFTFKDENGNSKGMHIDITEKAMRNLKHQPSFEAQPWSRCLEIGGKKGEVDAIVSSSYKPERAEFLYYPADAATAEKSKWRITQAEYIVVTYIDDPYVFKGDWKTLPQPVRAPKGYSIVDDLKKQGIEADIAKGDSNNVAKLIRDKNGSVVTTPLAAKTFDRDPRFVNKLKMHSLPLISKSYFMVFSKSSKVLTAQERQMIWDEIAKVRDDEDFMLQLLTKY